MRNLASKTVRLALAVVALVAAVVPNLWGQQKPQLELVYADAVPLPKDLPQYILVPPHCDVAGNTYYRFTPVLGRPQTPVTKISPMGQVVAKFSLDAVPYVSLIEGAAIRDFAVDNRERVHLLLSKDAKAYIIVYSAKGEFENATELIQPNFFPTQVVIFSSGPYLVSGVLRTDSAGPATGRLFSGVFDTSGNLVKEIDLPPSSPSEGEIPIAAGPGARMVVPGGISYAMIFEAAGARQPVAGDDDYAYILLRTSPPMVFVIASDGTLARTLKITPPAVGLVPLTPAEVSGRLIVPFAEHPDPNRGENYLTGFVVYDASTGADLIQYGLPRAPGGYLSCYTPSTATFFTPTVEGPVLVHAVPR